MVAQGFSLGILEGQATEADGHLVAAIRDHKR